MRKALIGTAGLLAMSLAISPLLADAQTADVPAAIWRDPPADAAHPAKLVVLHIPSGGVAINGVAYLASGPGPHPTVIVCHGLPGNEKNLDVAQAFRRQGWNAITFNYRGSWGSPGAFHFAQNPQDLHAVLEYLRAPAQARMLGIDVTKLAVVGHSMGGWATAMDGGTEPGVVALAIVSAANIGQVGMMPHAGLVPFMHENDETLTTSDSALADELATHAAAFNFEKKAQTLVHVPLLALTADDGLAGMSDALVAAIRKAGGTQAEIAHVATDHSWSDRRIELETRLIRFLQPYLH
jgi:pimeloyl-ACP methyl ester carboxylesterase